MQMLVCQLASKKKLRRFYLQEIYVHCEQKKESVGKKTLFTDTNLLLTQ